MVSKNKESEFIVKKAFGSNGLSNFIHIEHKHGYQYFIRPVTIEGEKLTLMFDNFSVSPIVISKTNVSMRQITKSDIEETLKDIYNNNVISVDYDGRSIKDIIIELRENDIIAIRTFNQMMADYDLLLK